MSNIRIVEYKEDYRSSINKLITESFLLKFTPIYRALSSFK